MFAMARWPAVAMAILSVILTGCSDRTVSIDEIEQLKDLRDVHVTLAPEVFSMGEGARIGVASDRRERVYFAVVVGDTKPRRVTIDGRAYLLVSGCAGAGFYATTDRFSRVAVTVESAVYDKLAPDAYCEG